MPPIWAVKENSIVALSLPLMTLSFSSFFWVGVVFNAVLLLAT